MRHAWWALCVFMCLDWLISAWAVDAGYAHEANPLPWASPDWMPVVKLGALVLAGALLWMMRRHWPVMAERTLIGAATAMGLVVAWNALLVGQAVTQ